MARKRKRASKPSGLRAGQTEWNVRLNRPQAVAVDMVLDYVIDSMVYSSASNDAAGFAKRFTMTQLRAIREKVHVS